MKALAGILVVMDIDKNDAVKDDWATQGQRHQVEP